MHPIIAVIFDFDDTLAHDTTTDFIQSLGIDPDEFWTTDNHKLISEGWDPIPAYMFQLLQWSNKNLPGITKKNLQDFGNKVRFFGGIDNFFPHLDIFVKSRNPQMSLEFYIISSGLGEIIRNSKIKNYMTEIFASDFSYGQGGEIEFPKRIVSFTDKTRYLFQISKGLIGPSFAEKPFEVNNRIQSDEIRIPFNHMIYIGDGFTDIPCFSILKRSGGKTIAVYDKNNPGKKLLSWKFAEENRVSNIHSADYRPGSDLTDNLEMILNSIVLSDNGTY